MSSATNSIYFLIANALLPLRRRCPCRAGRAGRGQRPGPAAGAEPGGGRARRGQHGRRGGSARRETPPSGPSWQRRGFGDPKGIPPRPSPPCRGFRPPRAAGPSGQGGSRSVPPRRAPPAVLPREELPAVGEEEVTGRERSGTGFRQPRRAGGTGRLRAPARPGPQPAPPAGSRGVNECRNE